MAEKARWTLKVPVIGTMQFRTGSGGSVGQGIFKAEERAVVKYFCPEHPKQEVKGHRMYQCPKDGKMYGYHEVTKKYEGKQMSWDQLKTKYPRTTSFSVGIVIKEDAVPRLLLDYSHAYYLVPIDSYDNILKVNQFIKTLKDLDGIALTSKGRARSGSMTAFSYGIFADMQNKALVMCRIRHAKLLRSVPPEAVFRRELITQQMQQSIKVVEKRIYKPKDMKKFGAKTW